MRQEAHSILQDALDPKMPITKSNAGRMEALPAAQPESDTFSKSLSQNCPVMAEQLDSEPGAA